MTATREKFNAAFVPAEEAIPLRIAAAKMVMANGYSAEQAISILGFDGDGTAARALRRIVEVGADPAGERRIIREELGD